MIRRKKKTFRHASMISSNSRPLFNFFYFSFPRSRAEIKTLRQGVSPKKEKLTEWLSSSIAELRSEISELQASASNLTKSCHQRNLLTEDIRAIRDEMNTFKLEVNAIKTRQDKSDVLLRELREETFQSAEDYGKSYHKHKTVSDNKLIDLWWRRIPCEMPALRMIINIESEKSLPTTSTSEVCLRIENKLSIRRLTFQLNTLARARARGELGYFFCLPSPFENAFKYLGEGTRIMAIDYSEKESLAAKVFFSIPFPCSTCPNWSINLL